MKLNIEKDLLQQSLPNNDWLFKDTNKDIIRSKSENVKLPLSNDDELTMKKLIDFVRCSQSEEYVLTQGDNPIRAAVGLAAPQIGVNKNMFYARFDWGYSEDDKENENNTEDKEQDLVEDVEEFAMINCEIISRSSQMCALKNGEGCLSVDGDKEGYVPRNYKIIVKGFDWISNEEVELVLRGYQSIVFQHELEHNIGLLYYDKINKKDPWNMDNNLILI